MPLSEVALARPRKRPANAENDPSAITRRSRHGNKENKARPKPRGRRVLSKCTWKFCHEPDQNNFGPQLIVTEPNGSNHYLVDPETFMRKLRYPSAGLREENKIHMNEKALGAMVVDDKIYNADDVDDGDGNEDHIDTITAQTPMKASAKLRTRLRGGIMLRWRKRNSANILPLHDAREPSSSPPTSDVQGRTERIRIFDISGCCSDQYHCSGSEEVLSLLKLFGGLGI